MPEHAPPSRKRIKELEVMVAEVVVETPDTVTLVLFTGNDRLEYRPGHFCTIDPHQFPELERFTAYLEDQKGKREPPRAYSLSSAPHERYVAITIKEERYTSGVTRFPPLLSPALVRETIQGRRLEVVGFTGPYVLPDDVAAVTDHLVHLVAGSGAVPNFSMLKHALHLNLPVRHTWLCSNKTWQDILFRRELEELEQRYPEKLTVVHTLTREQDEQRLGPKVKKGRIGAELLRALIPDPSACRVYACGPAISRWDRERAKEKGGTPEPRFLESALEKLAEVGVPDEHIVRESYG
ncbi:MAG: ferredoxin reductase domain-containing protein [Myxococcaceae bacterium]